MSRCSDVEQRNRWIASIIMHPNAQQGTVLNIIVGIVGAIVNVLAGYLWCS